MARRQIRNFATQTLTISLLAGAAFAQPNIVFIVVDDAGYVDFGFQGSTEIPTPNLDALAMAGLRFNQAHTGQACSPSRAAFLTGVHHNRWGYEANLQNTNNPATDHFEGLPNSATTMFEHLQGLGYSTGVYGKWHVGGMDDVVDNGVVTVPGTKPPKQGVDHFIGFQAGGGLQEMFLNPDGTNNVSGYNSGGRYWSDLWGDLTVDYIDQQYQSADPFFVYASFNDPHSPINEAPSFDDPRLDGLSGLRRRYASELLTVDDNVGRIVDKLTDPNGDGNAADSIMDETMFVFINDNGGVLGNSADNGDLRGAKGDPYDGGTRVPMFISGAGIDPGVAGGSYDKLVHSVDIVPTMIAAAGGNVPAGLDGVNLLPFANGQDSSNPHTFVAQRVQEDIFYRTNEWKLLKSGYEGEWELYDFSDVNNQSEDPADNQAATNPQQLDTMIRLLTDWEVTIDKQRFPSTDETIAQFNLFDDFRYGGNTATFSAGGAWVAPSGGSVTMRDRDSHSGTVFRFGTSGQDYTATNDLRRMNELEFIANGFVFEGEGATGSTATIAGLPVLLTKNLGGAMPRLELAATEPRSQTGGAAQEFDLALNVQLHEDLQIVGDGSQKFRVSGDITEYRSGRTITKTGLATIEFEGRVEATGGGYQAQQGTSRFANGSVLEGNLDVSAGATADLQGTIEGNALNRGTLKLSATQDTTNDIFHLTPTLGDGDIDSRNSGTRGDQDSEILVGSVSNATSTSVERVQRALLSFDLSALPDDATILDAAVTLQFAGNDSSSANNISGDLQLIELTEAPVFVELGAENVSWLQRDAANEIDWAAPGGTLGPIVAEVRNGDLPDPRTVVTGGTLPLESTGAMLGTLAQALVDDSISFALVLPGEEADMAAMIGDRDLYRIASNESAGAAPAVLSITVESIAGPNQATIEGDFLQDAGGVLQFDLGGVDQFTQLAVSGLAALDGELVLTVDPTYDLVQGDTFTLLTAGTLSGQFANVASGQRLAVANGMGSFEVRYDNVTNAVELLNFLLTPLCDFDGDGSCDIGDLNALLAVGPIAGGVSVTLGVNDQFDLNGDGMIDLADRDSWLALAADENNLMAPYKLGDANLDGVVDGQDFIAWNEHKFSASLQWNSGDFNGDGAVDGQDFIEWNVNKFTSSLPDAVPEPQWSVFACMFCALLLRQAVGTPA